MYCGPKSLTLSPFIELEPFMSSSRLSRSLLLLVEQKARQLDERVESMRSEKSKVEEHGH